MPNFCLVPKAVDTFKARLIDGSIDPARLSKMSSEERHAFFKGIVGEENAKGVNALFEGKLLLKNQQAGMVRWAQKVAGITPEVRRDMITRIQRIDHILDPKEEQQFLKDLASTKLGVDVTQNEAKQIATLSQRVQEAEAKASSEHTFKTPEDRLSYGMSKVNLENYVNDLKIQSKAISLKEHPITVAKNVLKATPGTLKSMVSSLDNSFFGRQGIKTLINVRTSNIWLKTFLKSWVDIGRVLKGGNAIDVVKADIFSRPNAINGKYRIGGYGLDALTEEAFPSSAPAKIPLFGRLFRASEEAYNGAALRMRADLADRFITMAEKQGINTMDRGQAQGIGQLVGGMTGRGKVILTPGQAKGVNVILFSVKFLKSNFDVITAHRLGFAIEKGAARTFVRKEAAKNLAGIVTSVATALTVAKAIDPNSVDLDPRSSNFGKIKLFGHWTDITGGLGAVTTLASRLVPTEHNGQWGLWQKTKSGNYVDLTGGKYGQQNGVDIVNQFFEGKLSPLTGVVRDFWSGQNYQGEKPTIRNELTQATVPISLQTYTQLKDAHNGSVLGSMIADGLGFSVSTPHKAGTNWNQNPTKELQQFKQKVGDIKFTQANQEYNTRLEAAKQAVINSSVYKALPDDQKSSTMAAVTNKVKTEVFKQYGFKYYRSKPSISDKQSKEAVLNLVP